MSGQGITVAYPYGLNATNSSISNSTWIKITVAFEVINFIVLTAILWTVTALIAYGTKNRRWRKGPGGSSLTSGTVYVICTISVVLFLPRIISVEAIYFLPRIINEKELWNCDLVCDIATGTYSISAYSAYFYICVRQRVIYNHPFVKERVATWANWMSRVMIILITGAAIALCLSFVLPTSFEAAAYGCVPKEQQQRGNGKELGKNTKIIILILTYIFLQMFLVFLSVYPAACVKFESADPDPLTPPSSPTNSKKNRRFCWIFSACSTWIKTLVQANESVSPIQLTVRRTALSTVAIVASDILVVIIAEFTTPKEIPMAVLRTIYNIGSLVVVFCMVWTFGNADKIFTLFCPTSRKVRAYTMRRRQRAAEEIEL